MNTLIRFRLKFLITKYENFIDFYVIKLIQLIQRIVIHRRKKVSNIPFVIFLKMSLKNPILDYDLD